MPNARTLYPNAVFAFLLLAAGAFVAFWPQYFSQLTDATLHAHAHGLSMSAWIVLLIGQAWLIRTGRRGLHRQTGKISFFLAPVIAISTLSFAHSGLVDNELSLRRLYVFYLQISLLIVFLVAYALAIYNRRNPPVHARLMICTALAMLDPIQTRLIVFYGSFPEGLPPQYVTYAVIDLILVALLLMNWRQEIRLRVYPAMLSLFVVQQVLTFMLPWTSTWRTFAEWFRGLPLS